MKEGTMPTYEYKCSECGRVFSLMRRREARGAPAACPDCGIGTGKRQYTSGGLLRAKRVRGELQGEPKRSMSAEFDSNNVANATFVNCESSNNGKGGFFFGGNVNALMVDTKIHGNPTAITIRDGAQVRDYNTDIQ
jgi:putative FmdB family regulatory protein